MSEEQTESSFAEDTEHPPEFVCPITMEIMKDPVVAGDGISYERRAITQWLLSKHHSPMTGLPFSSKSVVTNQNLRSLIERHLDEKKGHGSKDSLPIDSKRLRFTHRTFYEKPLQAIVGKQLLDWYQVDIHRHPPHASYYCAHACTSGLLVYIGGYHGVDMESQSIIRMYDTATCTWSLFPLHVIPISAFTAVTFGVEIFAFGGMIALPSSGGLPRPTNHVWSLNLRNEEFAQITTSGSIPRPVFNATTVLIGEKMFVFGGGHHAHGPNNDVYALNLKTYVWEKCEVNGDIPEPRLYHNAVAHGNDMYIFGGAPDVKTTEGRDIIFGDLYCLHTDSLTWEKIELKGDFPSPRGSFCLFIIDEHLYLFGGFNGVVVFNDLYRMDLSTRIWENMSKESTGTKPSPRAGSACLVQGKRAFIYGGFSTETSDFNEMYVLDLSSS